MHSLSCLPCSSEGAIRVTRVLLLNGLVAYQLSCDRKVGLACESGRVSDLKVETDKDGIVLPLLNFRPLLPQQMGYLF